MIELIKPSFQILTPQYAIEGMLTRIEAAGRTCYKSESLITPDSSPEFVKMIIKRGHLSVLEHESLQVRFICDRGVTHEMVRHRIASFSQESTRYVDYQKHGIQFIIPPWCDIEPGSYESTRKAKNQPTSIWMSALLHAAVCYRDARTFGWSPQQARAILPNSLKTEIVMTANLREWRHFFDLRCAGAAHPQMRELAIPLVRAFADRLPIVFDDITSMYGTESTDEQTLEVPQVSFAPQMVRGASRMQGGMQSAPVAGSRLD